MGRAGLHVFGGVAFDIPAGMDFLPRGPEVGGGLEPVLPLAEHRKARLLLAPRGHRRHVEAEERVRFLLGADRSGYRRLAAVAILARGREAGRYVDAVRLHRQRILEVLTNPAAQFHSPEFSMNSGESNPVRYRVTLSNMTPGRHDLVLHRGTLLREDLSNSDADATLICDSETFILLFYKRITPDEAVRAGKLGLLGTDELVSDFKTWLNDVTIRGLH